MKSRARRAALGEIIPGAQVLDIPNRDHMRAVGDKVYKAGVLEFLVPAPLIAVPERLEFPKFPTTLSQRLDARGRISTV